MFYPYHQSSHNIAYAKQLFDYLTNQQQLSKTEAIFQIAEEMGISCLNILYNWLNADII